MRPASVSRYLEQHGVHFSVVEHSVAYTAQEEAAATHVPGREWAKAVVCRVDDQPTLAVLPADRLVDLDRFREACGARSVRLASKVKSSRSIRTAKSERCRRSVRCTSSRSWSTGA